MKSALAGALAVTVSLAGLSSAHAAVTIFTANLDGASEAPPNASPGTGFARVDFDPTAHTMRVQATFSSLLGTTTAAHIHAPAPLGGTAGVATQVPTFGGFPLGVTSGTYDHIFDMTLASSYNPAFITLNGGTPGTAESALFARLIAGEAYFNIHSSAYPGGEIRGFLSAVPEPATWLMIITGFGMIGGALRQRRMAAT